MLAEEAINSGIRGDFNSYIKAQRCYCKSFSKDLLLEEIRESQGKGERT